MRVTALPRSGLYGAASAALISAMRFGELHNTAGAARALLEVDKQLLQGAAAEIIQRALHWCCAREPRIAVELCCQHVPVGQEDSPTCVLVVAQASPSSSYTNLPGPKAPDCFRTGRVSAGAPESVVAAPSAAASVASSTS